jgi:hypothetical protein
MDAPKRGMGQLTTFSDHLAARSSRGFPQRQLPSREEVESNLHEMEPFRNDIPMTDFEMSYPPDWPLKDTSTAQVVSDKDVKSRCRKVLLQKLIVPTTVVTIPMAIIAAGLLGLVFGYRVKSDETLFPSPGDAHNLKGHTYLLVNFSASEYIKRNIPNCIGGPDE